MPSFGDDGGGEPRVPIPNTTVKPSSADGTWTAGSWESRTLPSEPTFVGICFVMIEASAYASEVTLLRKVLRALSSAG